ncbi:CHASE2 domain-containing protein [Laspinema sp. D1]|uniref:CHASE2 domain-containing protein n=1 Tax=Laspinema palackyanum TaxID=3231601 RepID=UPI00348AC4D2|nr:CHASE2 domain-containing protein [Laspinema sp. D2b]
MTKVIVLKIMGGDFDSGFSVSLQVWDESGGFPSVDKSGYLPPHPHLEGHYFNWQTSFRGLNSPNRGDDFDFDDNLSDRLSSDDDLEACRKFAKLLEENMKTWLLHTVDAGWQQIREKVVEELAENKGNVRIMIQANPQLWKMPWLEWDVFANTNYPEIGMGVSPLEYQKLKPIARSGKPGATVRILAVFGNNENIDLEPDKQAIAQLPNVELEPLDQPSAAEVIQKLRDKKGWDIFFFAGHSQTKGDEGIIYINERESLEIRQFKEALKEAIRQGLQLAIFNSCDGLGLAQKLGTLQLPIAIVMKEPVPDKVAQCFLKEFLKEYADGAYLYTAVRRAQARLEEFLDFPGCTGLPIICQNPAEVPPTWEELRGNGCFDTVTNRVDDFSSSQHSVQTIQCQPLPSWRRVLPRKSNFREVIIFSVAIALVLIGLRIAGVLQPWELRAFDYLMRKQTVANYAPHIAVILATEKDFQILPEKGQLFDITLARLIKKIKPYKPAAIGFDIYRDAPIGEGREELVKQMQQQDAPIAICQTYIYGEPEKEGHLPPEGFPEDRLSFNDVPKDADGIIRRHLLQFTPHASAPCKAKYAFSLQLALAYLEKNEIKPQTIFDKKKVLQLGQAIFVPIDKTYAGGYQKLDPKEELGGYQVLLNYRPYRQPYDIAETVSITDVLDEKINLSYLRDRVVLIGYKENDSVMTPFAAGHIPPQELPGVFLQAQMVSQIIDAALGNRPLLRWLPRWGNALWIWWWSLVGALLSWRMRSLLQIGVFTGISLAILYQVCFALFKQGLWMPLVPSALALVLATLAPLMIYQIRKTPKIIQWGDFHNVAK